MGCGAARLDGDISAEKEWSDERFAQAAERARERGTGLSRRRCQTHSCDYRAANVDPDEWNNIGAA